MVTPKIIALFPGQGSQQVGMGKDLVANFKIAQTVFEEASEAIHLDLKKLCFEGPEDDLTRTENTQPCLLTTSLAAFRVTQSELGLIPHVGLGHSLGEYSALVAADVFSLSKATQWVRERGLAMQTAVPQGQGGMLAILGLDLTCIQNLCKTAQDLCIHPAILEPANDNAPGQIVVSGSQEAIQHAIQLVKTNPLFSHGRAIPLAVSAPFHCQLMAPAAQRMEMLFTDPRTSEKPKTLKFPYVPNRTAQISENLDTILPLLIEQIDHPVLWRQSIEALLEQFQNESIITVEFGPKKILSGLMKRMTNPTTSSCRFFDIHDSASLKQLESQLCH